MNDREKTLYSVLFCIALVLGWVFVVYAPLRTETQHTENMIRRKMNRMGVRAKLPEVPNASKPKLREHLAELEEQRADLWPQIARQEHRFVSLESVDGIKALRLEIASLAEWTGLNVIRFGELDKTLEVTDSIEALQSQIRAPYGRPVLGLEATGRYSEIVKFVHNIGKMDLSAAIMSLSVTAPDFKAIERNPDIASHLNLRMEIAL